MVMMMHSQSLITCLLLLLLTSSPNQGYGRELGLKLNLKHDNTVKSHNVPVHLFEGIGNELKREMIEVMDYDEPGANTNPKNGFLLSPPPPPAPPRP